MIQRYLVNGKGEQVSTRNVKGGIDENDKMERSTHIPGYGKYEEVAESNEGKAVMSTNTEDISGCGQGDDISDRST